MVRKRNNTKSDKGLSLKTSILLILIVLFIGIGVTTWYFAAYKVVWNDYLDIEVKVPSDNFRVGFNADPVLAFGKVPPGATSIKETNIWNDEDFPVKIEISVRGDVAPWISVKESDFILEPNESKKVKFWASVPQDYEVPKDVDYVRVTGQTRIRHLRI